MTISAQIGGVGEKPAGSSNDIIMSPIVMYVALGVIGALSAAVIIIAISLYRLKRRLKPSSAFDVRIEEHSLMEDIHDLLPETHIYPSSSQPQGPSTIGLEKNKGHASISYPEPNYM